MSAPRFPNLVCQPARRFDRGGLQAVWTSDTTYLATRQRCLSLCEVCAACSPRGRAGEPEPIARPAHRPDVSPGWRDRTFEPAWLAPGATPRGLTRGSPGADRKVIG